MDQVEAFNSLAAAELTTELLAVCASPEWGRALVRQRPFPSREALVGAAGRASGSLGWPEVLRGLAAHPRIGERAPGASQEAGWSRREQSAAAGSQDDATRAELVALNQAYEERFGHVFLIFASGRTQAEIVAVARERLGNDEATEREIVAAELGKIALLRLERLLDALG